MGIDTSDAAGWSKAEIEMAARLWTDLDLSAGDIAARISREFGTRRTRNALCGLAHRKPALFAPRGRIVEGAGRKAKAPAAKKAIPGNIRGKKEGRAFDPVHVAPKPTVADAFVYDAASLHLPLAALSAGQCRWPVNDAEPGEPHLFCGLKRRAGCAYCDHHASRAGGGYSASEKIAWLPSALARSGRAA